MRLPETALETANFQLTGTGISRFQNSGQAQFCIRGKIFSNSNLGNSSRVAQASHLTRINVESFRQPAYRRADVDSLCW